MITWQYIAGFFDGEGCIGLKRHSKDWGYGYPVLRLSQSGDRGLNILTLIREFMFSVGITSCRISKQRHLIHQDKYTLTVDGWLSVLKLCYFILPYVIVKKAEIQDVIRYRKLYPAPPRHAVLIKSWATRRAMKAA